MAAIHNRKIIAGLALCMSFFAGCGVAKVPDAVVNTSLIIDKDGGVTSHIVEALDRDYYSLEELKKMAQEEMTAYNTAHQTGTVTPVTLKRVEALADTANSAVVTYVYDSAATYEAYTGSSLFYGTVADAAGAGYTFGDPERKLSGAGKKKSIKAGDLASAAAGKHVVIWEGQGNMPDTEAAGIDTRIYCPYKVVYISERAEVMEDGSIETAGLGPGDYPVIIVLDK